MEGWRREKERKRGRESVLLVTGAPCCFSSARLPPAVHVETHTSLQPSLLLRYRETTAITNPKTPQRLMIVLV